MKPSSLAATATAAALLATTAGAQAQGFALDQLDPTPAGDVFFGVPSPAAPGHLEPRAYIAFDYGAQPIHLRTEDVDVVAGQAFLRVDASLALWNRVLLSVDMPLAVLQSSNDPGLPGITFTALEAPQVGDLRLGLRVRLLGEDAGPFQLGLGGYVFAPTGNAAQYTGEGAVRGAPHLSLGGRAGSSVGFAWTASGGVELTGAGNPHVATFGAGVGLLLGGDTFQIGPEVYGTAPLGGGDLRLSATPDTRTAAEPTAELLIGAKLRVLRGLTFGAAAGPGLTRAVGTPSLRAIGLLGWAPPAERAAAKPAGPPPGPPDRDDDGIQDGIDACPDTKGQPSPDPTKDGCPPADRDGDGVLDVDDACPTTPGERSGDITRNGCPGDTDGDGFHDGVDACKTTPGVSSDDPEKMGCPPDGDNDGVPDDSDACPTVPGARTSDKRYNGCPEDPDGDGVKFGADACPNEKGVPDPDPKLNGCKRFVRVTESEIVTSRPIQFVMNGKERWQTVDRISDEILYEVRDAIQQDPSIEQVEVQGHTDDEGTEQYNLDLSQQRADAVRKWLVQAGVPESKLIAKGYGFEKPLGDNRVRTGRQKNRRVQFMITKRSQR
ncbi:OmpA family protein [Chondromyces apiculatus]|uniref:Outer membrane protein A-like protein n=1 Tax=Chondromyces apiculatus DSM 436 TaxID=1192034 RepID=A0A017TEG7_9BACT|nr:OmpA family protein [Chondromyces apiculatus]EYF07619.1 Outer membrane protein A-like protein [Chondromyces apiculatus DSM 436]